jgi:ABC-type Fe3+ transport system permease subunit
VAVLLVRPRMGGELPDILADWCRLNVPGNRFSLWTRVRWLARPALAAMILIYILAIQEVHSSILLASPGQETISIRAMTLLHYAPDSLVAAFCLLGMAATVIPAGIVWGAECPTD